MPAIEKTPFQAQRNIYRWYDERYSDDAFNIYSEEWEVRFTGWHQHSKSMNIEHAQDDLEMGEFFLSDPIAAFSLWNVLQVCYDLDAAVCGSTVDAKQLNAWKQKLPFKYLGDLEVRIQWQRSLKKLRERIKNPIQETEAYEDSWESRMHQILLAVERFEDSFAVLKENFQVNMAGKAKCAAWMEDKISEEIGMKFSLITNLLEIKDDEFVRDDEDQDEDFQPPPPLVPSRPPYSTWPVHEDPDSAIRDPPMQKDAIMPATQDPEPLARQIMPKTKKKASANWAIQRFHNFKTFFKRREKP